MHPDLSLEQRFHGQTVCGIDEAGRGCWAGPVVAACVHWPDSSRIPSGINDSKKLTKLKREALYADIYNAAIVGIGMASTEEIDALNILGATKLAMQRAYEQMPQRCDVALVDGNQPPVLPCKTMPIIQGDSKSLSIAAASIIAKVTRDHLMRDYAKIYPHYGFDSHAGYGTARHVSALEAHGICPLHRKSFAPIRRLLAPEASEAA